MATYPTSLAPDKTSVDPTGAITLTWTVDAQTHYQINYRRKGTTTWVQTGKISSTTKSYTIPANTLLKNEYYEWMVRVWYRSTQYAWSARATFLAAVPASAVVKETQDALRVVPLGKSTDTSNLRVKLASGTAEFDLVAPTHQAASRVRIATGTAVKAIAKPITTEVYSNYGDHSNTGYLREYSDHDNTGYDNHTNYSESYTKAYFYQAYYGAGSHTDYMVFYIESPNPPTYIYVEVSGYSELYEVEYSKRTTSYVKSGYDDHSNSGYGVYNNHSNNGYYYNQGA
jgi:hypothetical protein